MVGVKVVVVVGMEEDMEEKLVEELVVEMVVEMEGGRPRRQHFWAVVRSLLEERRKRKNNGREKKMCVYIRDRFIITSLPLA